MSLYYESAGIGLQAALRMQALMGVRVQVPPFVHSLKL